MKVCMYSKVWPDKYIHQRELAALDLLTGLFQHSRNFGWLFDLASESSERSNDLNIIGGGLDFHPVADPRSCGVPVGEPPEKRSLLRSVYAVVQYHDQYRGIVFLSESEARKDRVVVERPVPHD